ncbi:MAG: LUD domain-containing protein [Bacteroidales bacterium]|nr:LUD domain-containing protein [Bacteroidales bacterium]
MKESTSKEKVLKAIRHAQLEADYPKKVMDIDTRSSIFSDINEFPEIYFANQLRKVGGHFYHCKDDLELHLSLKHIITNNDTVYTCEPEIEQFLKNGNKLLPDNSSINFLNHEQGLKTASVVITLCECLVARFGTVVMSSRQLTGRKAHTVPKTHIVIALPDQIVGELPSAFRFLQNRYGKTMPSMLTFITGPSRTSAMQGDFVYGVTGAANLYVLYLDTQYER